MLMSWFISRSNGSRSGSLINEHLQPVKWECCVKFSDAKCSQLPEVAFEADVHSDIQLPFATGIQPATLIEVVAPWLLFLAFHGVMVKRRTTCFESQSMDEAATRTLTIRGIAKSQSPTRSRCSHWRNSPLKPTLSSILKLAMTHRSISSLVHREKQRLYLMIFSPLISHSGGSDCVMLWSPG
jgi:hypothetical protein